MISKDLSKSRLLSGKDKVFYPINLQDDPPDEDEDEKEEGQDEEDDDILDPDLIHLIYKQR